MTVFLFYVFVSLLWNAMAAADHRRHGGIGRVRQVAAFATFGLALAGLPWFTADGAYSANSWMFLLSACLPLSFVAAAVSSYLAARTGQRAGWILLPYHALVAIALGTRWAMQAGIDVGSLGESLSLSYAAFQTVVFVPAIWLPTYVHLPWLMRPSAAPQSITRFVSWLGVAFGLLTTVAVLWIWVPSYGTVSSWREWSPPRAELPHAELPRAVVRSTKVLESIRETPDDRWLDQEFRRLDDLGVESATLVVSAELLRRGWEALGPIDRFVERNRAAGRELILFVQGDPSWYQTGWPQPDGMTHSLGRACRVGAARYQPNTLLVASDVIAVSSMVRTPGGVETAKGVVRALADSVRAGNDRTLVGMYGFEPWPTQAGADSHAVARRELFQWAASDSSPVQRVGFVLHAGFGGTDHFAALLAYADTALGRVGPTKKAWVYEFAVCPTVSGEQAQAHHLEWVVRWAAGHPAIEGVSQLSLGDYAERVGLVSALGRKRLAYDVYQELVGPVPPDTLR